jgi:hypothetical protein
MAVLRTAFFLLLKDWGQGFLFQFLFWLVLASIQVIFYRQFQLVKLIHFHGKQDSIIDSIHHVLVIRIVLCTPITQK